MSNLKQDIIISDPPWGGTDYKQYDKLRLHLDNIDITCIINQLYQKNLFNLFVLLVPNNFDLEFFWKNINSKAVFLRNNKQLFVIYILNDKILM